MLNLILNARDAVGGRGTVHVRSDVVEVDDHFAAAHGGEAGTHSARGPLPISQPAVLLLAEGGRGRLGLVEKEPEPARGRGPGSWDLAGGGGVNVEWGSGHSP